MGSIASWPITLGLAAAMGVLALAGVWVASALRLGGRAWVRRALGFASGFMFAFALVDILPEALAESPQAHVAAVAGFVLFYVAERLFDIHLCPAGADDCATHEHSHGPVGGFALAGLATHSVVDGLAIGSALVASPRLAILVAVAVALHKVPDGFCMGSLLCIEEQDKLRWDQALLFAAATPLGIVAAYAGLAGAEGSAVGLVLGLSAGSFLYIAAADLLPEAHMELRGRGDRAWVMAAVVLGAVLAVSLTLVGGA